MADGADPRLTPARPDLAASFLKGRVEAAAFADPRPMVVATAAAPLTAAPDADAPMTTQLLLGEAFDVYEARRGWVWGQATLDGYVGYAPEACFAAPGPAPTHRVAALHAILYAEPDLKSRPVAAAPFGARVAAEPAAGAFHALAGLGYAPSVHLAPAASVEPDWVAVAERFVGAPYLWGGRSAAGIDCSGLVQIARQAAGLACPRDSDMQRAAPGEDAAAPARGDLVFWRGHVGVLVAPDTLLHANAHHMAVVAEPLAEAGARIAAAGLPVLARRRWPSPAPRA
jgi:cell wall-associated NlpC family hydrolase